MRLADIVIYYIMSQIAEPWSSGSNIDAIIIETSSRTWPPIAVGGSSGLEDEVG